MFAEELVSCKPNLATVLDNTSPSVQDSSLLATCFGNRSAVLYELGRLEVTSSCKPSATHTMSIGPLVCMALSIPLQASLVLVFVQECLADIKRALAFGFPEASEYKLYRRQAWCLAQRGQERESQEGSPHH